MFVLDTNILSAMMRRALVSELAAWIADQPEEALFTAAVCST
jgi:predicted nucleic acid-binding protein